ncbi:MULTISPECIES: hypothetical protein [Aneurinibacillus]|uniref:Uncharacterized protein n=1 Tax=Aneurinibacillus thermoaerophilus TaxID=143495 RepID=A0A1G8FDI4_ANETH|nr:MULTISPECIES: hypothetical protein [Aneurinibacillus]AMA74301.1 hypothetical protein ACH33_16790 [Aneurinibacillus sp. XH2]MED0738957.1 hypothetical protein [Aneurinibacillus thermoaerophilus]MED0759155.1 hypothetical protein [Aneurinibacillus thermoaerophilus]MED0762592.1 hypothetical protein [Aneurinibacillus thermoaerophilus]QYY43114.1 hypothetical protein K3F53_02030 [Aneurinibacillus thermoaerophilus]
MEYLALVKRLDPHIEEEVTLEVEGIEFTGFTSVCPYEIEVGKSYPVSIGFTILDELEIRVIYDEKKELERIGSGYKYYIRGILNRDSIDAGITILDEDEYFADYLGLIGKYVELQVDRISVEFLKR